MSTKKLPFHETIQSDIISTSAGLRSEGGREQAMQLLSLFNLLHKTEVPVKHLPALLRNVREVPLLIMLNSDSWIVRIGEGCRKVLNDLNNELPEAEKVPI